MSIPLLAWQLVGCSAADGTTGGAGTGGAGASYVGPGGATGSAGAVGLLVTPDAAGAPRCTGGGEFAVQCRPDAAAPVTGTETLGAGGATGAGGAIGAGGAPGSGGAVTTDAGPSCVAAQCPARVGILGNRPGCCFTPTACGTMGLTGHCEAD